MFEQGVFGGAYFRPIKSGVTNKKHKNAHKEFDFLKDIDEALVARHDFDYVGKNKWGVKAGQGLQEWEEKSWIVEQDPYGWVQWYCRFYEGRRSDDDDRQVLRWKKFAGPKSGRWRTNLINKIERAGGVQHLNNGEISPVIRQGLLQWAYELTEKDYLQKKRKKK